MTVREWPGQHSQFLRCFIYAIYNFPLQLRFHLNSRQERCNECNIFAGSRTNWSITGSPIRMSSPHSGKLTQLLSVAGSLQKTPGRSNDKHKIQRRYEDSKICRICHNYFWGLSIRNISMAIFARPQWLTFMQLHHFLKGIIHRSCLKNKLFWWHHVHA